MKLHLYIWLCKGLCTMNYNAKMGVFILAKSYQDTPRCTQVRNMTVIPVQRIALHLGFAGMLSLIRSTPTASVHASARPDLQIFEPLQKYPLVRRICSVLFGVRGDFSVHVNCNQCTEWNEKACQDRLKHMVLKKKISSDHGRDVAQ